jgi:single-stranded-DNA-specific exonuclease
MPNGKGTQGHAEARWVLAKTDPAIIQVLSDALGVDHLLGQIIAQRGINNPEDAKKFYRSDLSDLNSPELMKGMAEAVDRLVSALRRHEKICVYGDYDVDGITSVSLLLGFLRKIGADVTYYIPARDREGYGLNKEAISTISGSGCSLIVAVDCGISANEEIAHAGTLGVDVIVVDHHQVPEELPRAAAILNPHRTDCGFPFKDLAAVGVSFFLLLGLRKKLRELGILTNASQPNLRESLDLVVLGTVADVVPLLGDNRILVKHGLKELTRTKRPGLIALKEVSGIGASPVTARMVGFGLAPRLNAAGRLEDARYGVELLITADTEHAKGLAEELNWQNARRQKIEEEIFNDVNTAIQGDASISSRKSIVMSSDAWHPGVIGIVASRIARRYYRPTILISLQGERGRGSGRSIDGFHIFQGLSSCSDLIVEFGGHKSAAGLTIEARNVPDFIERFEEVAAGRLTPEHFIPKLELDAQIDAETVDEDFLANMEKLEPHGMCNPQPIFLGNGLRVARVKLVGQGQHLKMSLVAGRKTFDAICFGLESKHEEARNLIDIAFCPEFNEWMGNRSIQFRVQDFRPTV